MKPGHMVKTNSDKFWEKVSVRGEDECWPWVASTFTSGYGQYWERTTPLGEKPQYRALLAHRYSYFLKYGEFPPNRLCICHKCDNVKCVNPNHFFLGTRTDNSNDKIAKNRMKIGFDLPHTRLSESDVQQIRDLVKMGFKQVDVASQFGISQTHVHKICHGKSRPHVK